ncbi:MAG: (Fe-S)-binding protein [Eggerthellaceae bacterium]|nr:(Fe-S)-binding protein [Eggerthellaceae bacterium]
MNTYSFSDALTGSTIQCDYPGLQTLMVEADGMPQPCETLFFPGCSFINYGMPLVDAVYATLKDAGVVEGISLLCCGKILKYEPNGTEIRANYEKQLCERLAALGVKTIVTACPNCVKALRDAVARDAAEADIEIIPLPAVLADLGYRIDSDGALALLSAVVEAGKDYFEPGLADQVPMFCIHDSCPDRKTGEFAAGVRTLLADEAYNECEHNRKTSFCCGSLVRATGNYEAADAQAQRHGDEAIAAQATGIVTVCVSCAFQLSMAQRRVPVFHYLELLYNYRIDWYSADAWMKLRFLFDESLGVDEFQKSHRSFIGLEKA